MYGDERRLVACDAVAVDAAPRRVLLFPWGNVESKKGAFIVDSEGVRLMIEAFLQHGADLPIDYEHQTLGGDYAAPDGRAPAAGWIKTIEPVAGQGLFGLVQWTPGGEQTIRAREYRYLSPVVSVRKDDQRAVALHSVGLTNKPAIVNMPALVNRDDSASASRGGLNDRLLVGVDSMPSVDDLKSGIVPELRKVMGLAMNSESDLKAMLEVAVSLLTKALIQSDRGGNREAVEAALAVIATVQEWMEDDQWGVPTGVTANRAAIRNNLRTVACKILTRALYKTPDPATVSRGGGGSPSQARIDVTDTPEGRWSANADLRREFSDDKGAYLAFCKYDAKGVVQIFSREGTGNIRPGHQPACSSSAELEPEQAWQANADLRREFSDDFGAYKAFRKYDAAGVIRIFGQCRGGAS